MGAGDDLTAVIAELVEHVAPAHVRALGDAVMALPGCPPVAERHAIASTFGGGDLRGWADRLLKAWATEGQIDGRAVALALRTTSALRERLAGRSVVDLVWTGPDVPGSAFRQTEQALLEVVRGARRRIDVCTFAAYRLPSVAAALAAARARGVAVDLIIEVPEPGEGRTAHDPVAAFGDDPGLFTSVFVWPREKRPVDHLGRHGTLHAKFVLADDARLFVSSANLTEYALRLNMELGVLIVGGVLPMQLRRHLDHAKRSGLLTRRIQG